jgi:hypothetical protein
MERKQISAVRYATAVLNLKMSFADTAACVCREVRSNVPSGWRDVVFWRADEKA